MEPIAPVAFQRDANHSAANQREEHESLELKFAFFARIRG
jgi:hypothetical protein